MKVVALRSLALLLCAIGALAPAYSQASSLTFHERPGGGAEVLRLELHPAEIRLEGAADSVQLLVTGVRRDGLRVDLTREAKWVTPTPLVSVSEHGLLRPQQDGDGVLQIAVGELTAEMPVHVEDTATPLHPSFVVDVQPILARSGCSTGTCHGSANGKNGFKLSLRGYDPEFDHAALTDDHAGRRFNRAAPDKSLFLLKPTAAVPHEGGQLVQPDSIDYAVLRAWVQAGVTLDLDAPRVERIELFPADPTVPDPGMSQQFAVLAHYSDGRVRDVTALAFVESGNIEVAEAQPGALVRTLRRGDAPVLARFEGRYAATRLFVMGDRSGFEWQAMPQFNWIDELVDANLQRIRAQPSELCSDAEFLRRVHLDLTGSTPARSATQAFLLDRRDSRVKRDEVIDRLIGSPEFVEHWTNRWADLLQVNSKFLGPDGARAMREWLQGAVASNLPYDEFVTELLTGSGSTLENPPAAYFKVQRVSDLAMESTTQLFLGIRFNCNKCHDHPFERWTQRQHWETAAWLAQVRREDAPGSPKMPASEVMEPGEQPPAFEELITDDGALAAVVKDPNGRQYANVLPFTHDGPTAPMLTLRQQFAQWLTAEANPYFATSYANRLWSYFTGVGLIEPVDDLRAGNPPSNPELLRRLTEEFVRSDFDVREIMRVICRSRVYQQSVRTNRWNADDDVHYSHALPRRLTAEALYDAVHRATGARPRLEGVRRGTRAGELVDVGGDAADGFLGLFGRPPRETVCECERSSGTSLGQALNLVNGPTLAAAIEDPDNDIAGLVAYETHPREIVTELYLSFLCRLPTEAELQQLVPTFDGERANAAALRPDDRAQLELRMQAFEQQHRSPEWTPVEVSERRSDGGAELTRLPDGSVLAGGARPDRDVTTVVAFTDKERLTGVRLEVLADDSLPGRGPGRAENGNFVLRRFTVTAVPLANPTAARVVTFGAASADYSQEGFDVGGTLSDAGRGWAVAGQLGRDHEAWFACSDTTLPAGGVLLVCRLEQPYGGAHTVGRFRLSVTDSPIEIRHPALPDPVIAALSTPLEQRTAEQQDVVFRHYLASDVEMRDKLRLGAAQDLAWALANSSAFLFNR